MMVQIIVAYAFKSNNLSRKYDGEEEEEEEEEGEEEEKKKNNKRRKKEKEESRSNEKVSAVYPLICIEYRSVNNKQSTG